MRFKQREWQRRISHEFEAPAKVVIASFARDGYSKRLTAGTIGINIKTLRCYAKEHGIQFADRKDLRDECKAHHRVKGIVRNKYGRCGKPANI